MKEAKLYICAGIFIALTAIRLISPALGDKIADEISQALRLEQEQTVSAIRIGREIINEKPISAFLRSRTSEPQTEPSPSVRPTAAPTYTPAPEFTAEPTPTPEPTVHPAVTAFLKSQAAYSDYEVPEKVSYERPELPFEYTSPVEGVTSSGFGYRMHPIQNEVKYHYGTDFAAAAGSPIAAFADGNIVAQGDSDSFGKYVMIDHADGYRTLYAHCSEICMNCGPVKKGDVVALVGSTGAATGPHLHFELERGGIYYNPEFYL